MKSHYIGYYLPTEKDFETLWSSCIFILDTNVLLDLYRYPTETANSILEVFEKISDRLWVPFYVGLEFQRNRLKVISEQKVRFHEVKKIIEEYNENLLKEFNKLQLKERHSLINPDILINKIGKISNDFLEELDTLDLKQPTVFETDILREKIEKVILKNIGQAFEKQLFLDNIYQEGEERYKYKMPPGFKDEKNKEKGGDEGIFYYGGLRYHRKFGDLIIWNEIIEKAKNDKIKNIIFITNDAKEDWWWKIYSFGNKTIGPRPELIEEIKRKGDVDLFYMYTTSSFLKYSKDYLKTKINQEAINLVKDVSEALRDFDEKRYIEEAYLFVDRAVYLWLSEKYPETNIKFHSYEFPNFIIDSKDNKQAYDVSYYNNLFQLRQKVSHFLKSEKIKIVQDYEKINIVAVVSDSESLDRIKKVINIIKPELPANVGITIGKLEKSESLSQVIVKFKEIYNI